MRVILAMFLGLFVSVCLSAEHERESYKNG